MPLSMKELPVSERPYEKLKLYGSTKLSNAELLAIIIKTGTKDENSIEIANRVILLTQNLQELEEKSIEELTTIKGIGEIKAIQIKAVCELTKRMSKNNRKINIKISKPVDAAKMLMDEMKFEKQEKLKIIIMNSKNEVLRIKDIVTGDSNVANVSIKQIISEPLKMQAPKIILVHNHPSGDITPSKSDYELTKQAFKICKIIGIEMLDHIIIGNNNYESIFLRRDFKNEIVGL